LANIVDDKNNPEFKRPSGDDVVIDIAFTPELLSKINKKIKPKMSAGPDG